MVANRITRKGKFDAAHRILQVTSKCFNLHGHEYQYEVTLSWEHRREVGFAIDFQDMKDLFGTWVEEHLDHAFIANPADRQFVTLCADMHLKIYRMGGGTEGFSNPSAENIAQELFFVAQVLLENADLKVASIKLWETQNCWVECSGLSDEERKLFRESDLARSLQAWVAGRKK